MDEISKKNENFVIEGLQSLYIIDNIIECQEEIINIFNQYNNGKKIDYEFLIKKLEDANYNQTKIKDIVSSINMYASKVQYTADDFNNFKNTVKHNAIINNVTIKRILNRSEVIPQFSLDIINLGFSGINIGDKVDIALYNTVVNERVEKQYIINESIPTIKGKLVVAISDFISPQTPYEYNLDISISNNNNVYGQLTIKGINVRGGI